VILSMPFMQAAKKSPLWFLNTMPKPIRLAFWNTTASTLTITHPSGSGCQHLGLRELHLSKVIGLYMCNSSISTYASIFFQLNREDAFHFLHFE
jgi:hypothetical protein